MIYRLFVIATMFLFSSSLFAYEQPTHRRISEAAYDSSSLVTDLSFIKRLGFTETSFEEITSNSNGGVPFSAREWISEGANHEDTGIRSLNHFYNPLTNSALSVAIPLGGKPSPDWVLENPFPSLNDNSYMDAVDSYHSFLVAPPSSQNNVRKDKLNDVFFKLGHIIHHIEDMAQPEHVRDDQHLSVLGIEIDPSWYEEYSQIQNETDGSNFRVLMDNASSPVHLSKARDYWDSENLDGLAEFTNTNFVSNDTNFVLDGNMVNIDERFPYPVPRSITSVPLTELMPENNEGLALCQKLIADFQQFGAADLDSVCKLGFIETAVIGKHPVVATINERASTVSFFDRLLEKEGKLVRVCTAQNDERTCLPAEAQLVTTLNRFNFDAAYPFLIPKAVNYSAGMLDHFFRGKLKAVSIDLDENLGTIVEIQNVSKIGGTEFPMEDMTFQAICAEQDYSSFQVHNLVPVGNPQHISANDTFTVEMPRSSCKDIIVFGRGKIGDDEGVAVGRYQYTEISQSIGSNLRFAEYVQADLNGGIISNVRIQGKKFPHDFLRAEDIIYNETKVLTSGTVTYGPTYQVQGESNSRRKVTYNNYVKTDYGCSGACPHYFFDGEVIQKSSFLGWHDFEINYTKTLVKFDSYIQNWYPVVSSTGYEEGNPLGHGWDSISDISDILSEDNLIYYWNVERVPVPDTPLIAAYVFSGDIRKIQSASLTNSF